MPKAVPRFNLKMHGGRSFTVAALIIWNNLPLELQTCVSVSTLSLNLRLGYSKTLLVRTFKLLIYLLLGLLLILAFQECLQAPLEHWEMAL